MDSVELLKEAAECLGLEAATGQTVPADAFLRRPNAGLLEAIVYLTYSCIKGAGGKQVRPSVSEP